MEIQALRRKERVDAAAEAQRLQDGPNPSQETAAQRQAPEDAREADEIRRVFGSVPNPKKATDADAE